jgi:DNA mismatch endonuclease (patch repair protein)
MQSNRSKDTSLELAVRSALHRTGLRFRKHVQPIPGLRCIPDIVFPGRHLALFIDGCWWHACPEHGSYPQTNGSWWRTKLEANVARDRRNDEALMNANWHVMHVWEHQPIDEIVMAVRERLATLRPQ